jgi:hypothetical protein
VIKSIVATGINWKMKTSPLATVKTGLPLAKKLTMKMKIGVDKTPSPWYNECRN